MTPEKYNILQADIRNKLSPQKTLIQIIRNPKLMKDKKMMDKLLIQCEKNIKYLSNIPFNELLK